MTSSTSHSVDVVPPLSMLAGFPPVIDGDTRILILGSFPGKASLDAGQYYAHPRNQFWRLLGAVLNQDLVGAAYADRLRIIRSHGIGVWDVIAACARQGSLDSAIRQAQANDFARLRATCPELRRVCFNGQTSGKAQATFAAAGFDTLQLPSSSPAYAAVSYEQKLVVWRDILA